MAYGTYLLANPLSLSYLGNQAIREWQMSTRAHNVIEINDTSSNGGHPKHVKQEEPFGYDLYRSGTKGEIGSLHPEIREFNAAYDYIRAETTGYVKNTNSKGDFQYWRDILFVKPEYFIVTDYIKPENDIVNKYSQAWHLNPELEYDVDTGTKSIISKSGDQCQYRCCAR